MAHPKKIRATYKNGVIEPLDKLNLPEGQELELEFKVLPSAPSALSKEEKKT
jgi:predicted DNA-binding antitoxin AbrB/MazE fold protein